MSLKESLKKHFFLITLIFLMSFFPINAVEEDSRAIRSGETVSSSISSAGDMDIFHFYGTAGEAVVIVMSASNKYFSSYLELYGPDGFKETEGLDSLRNYQIQKSGLYTIVCSDYGADDTSEYSLSFVKIPGPVLSPSDADGGDMVSGDVLSAQIMPKADIDGFNFYGTAGDAINIFISASSQYFSSYLELYDPDGFRETESYDSIGNYQLLKSGLYTVVCSDYGADDTSEYSLSFTKIPPDLPPGIYNPTPPNGAGVSYLTSLIDWDDTEGASYYDVYFGPDVMMPLEKIGENITESCFALPPIVDNTTYYWKIVAKDDLGEIAGPVWNFTTCAFPETPSNPSPEDGAIHVPVNTDLSWDDSLGATSYDVYLGANSPNQKVGTVKESAFHPGKLNPGKTYSWKVVARNDYGETSGPEWRFTTAIMPEDEATVTEADGILPRGPVSGPISSDTTWTKAGSPYVITGNVLVDSGVTLTIEAGVEMKFQSGVSLQIDGILIARGVEGDRIFFTSDESSPGPGDWGYILFSDSSVDAVYDGSGNYLSGSIMEYCVVEYAGGASVSNNGGLRVNSSSPCLKDCVISNNSESGIRVWDNAADLKIENTEIHDNSSTGHGGGIYLNNGSATVSNGQITNNIATNSGGGIYASDSTLTVKDSTISDNSASNGGGIYSYNGTINILNNHVEDNVASSAGGGICVGGGTIDISDNIITGNTAENSSGGGMYICGTTGSFWIHIPPTGSVLENIIYNNSAGYQGGGVWIENLEVSKNIISGNSSGGEGGGVYESYGGSTLTYNAIHGNGAADMAALNFISSENCQYNTLVDNVSASSKSISIINFPNFNNNNIFNNTATYELYNDNAEGTGSVNAKSNWWGTDVDAEIQAKIYDWFDDGTKSMVDYSPFLISPNTAAPISPPADLTAIPGVTTITLNWSTNPESDVAGYRVYWDTDCGFPYANVVDVGNVTSYTILGITSGETYYVAVTAYDSDYAFGNDDPDTIVNENQTNGHESWYTKTESMLLPEIPTNPSPADGETGVALDTDLDWDDNIGATSYDVYFGASSPPPYVETTTESYYDPGTLDYNAIYFWKISAKNAYGSTLGAEWSFTTIAPPPVPEINIKYDTTDIPDGGSYDFGLHPVGTSTDVTFTIENTGTADLILSGSPIVTITGADEDQFNVQQQPTSPISDGGGSTTFIIRFSPTSEGLKSASISIGNNDADEDPYDITLNGTGVVLTGSIKVTIEPQGAIDAGAQWKRLCTTTWHGSGYTESDIIEGEVIVEFKDIAGWLKPENRIVSIPGGDTAVLSVTYTQLSGSGIFIDSGQSLGDSYSEDVALGDVDGDGDLDAFVANHGAHKVWLNDGSGTFTDSGQSLGTSYSHRIALGDLDGDGDLDAFVGNLASNKVWLNDGNGTFTDSGQSLGSSESMGIELGDLDCDGDLDAFVANYGANKVWLNNGSGTFTDSGQSLGNTSCYGMALGDVDGDGDLDAFICNRWNADKVWLNDGNGTFTDSGQDLGSSESISAALGDIDLDGDLDVFVASFSNLDNKVWLNDGSGTFTDSGQSLGNYRDFGVAFGDGDGDGDLDAFIANWGNANSVMLNNGSGIFTDSGQSLGDSYSADLALGDVDGDGDLDAFVANGYNTPGNKVWLNACIPPEITEHPQSQSINYDTVVTLSVTANSINALSYQWYQGDSGDTSNPVGNDSDTFITPNLTETTSYWVRVSNVCGSVDSETATIAVLPLVPEIDILEGSSDIPDGGSYDFGSCDVGSYLEVTFTIENTGSAGLTLDGTPIIIIGGTDSGEFSVEQQPTTPVDPGSSTTFILRFSPTSEGLKSASISISNNDADEDPYDITLEGTGLVPGSLLVNIEPQGAIDAGALWKRLCTTTWNDSGFAESGLYAGSVIVEFKDIPGWLKPDDQIVSITAGDTEVVTGIYVQLTGVGTFIDTGQNLGSGSSYLAKLGDLDGDGDLDAFVVNYSSQANKVWLNDGSGTFTDSGQSLGSRDSFGVALGDVDNDGDLDAFVANDGSNNVWLNNGSGTFTDSGQALGNGYSKGARLGDVDCDGDLDAFIANHDEPNKVWLNDGSGTFTDSGQSLGNSKSMELAFGDLDGDGDLDVFVANADNQPNRVWMNDGSGTFTDSGQSLASAWSLDVELGDLDGDGDLDAFIANSSSQANTVWLNDSSGIFTDSGQSIGSYTSLDVEIGDLDGDGDLDAFFANVIYQPNRIWLNNGSGNFTDSGQSLGNSPSYGAALGRINGDNSLDVFVANYGQANRVWLNACLSPSITDQPQSQTIDFNTTANLSITASSDSPLSYQWYQGSSGDTSTPVGSDSDSYTTPNLTETTSYWVRLSNDCGSTDSNTATISVLPAPFTNLSPEDTSIGVQLDTGLDWQDSSGATSYDVYLGTTSPPPYVASVTESYYDPGGLGACETYYWKIVARNDWGDVEGAEWSFETIIAYPGTFSNLSPGNGDLGVSLNTDLDWEDSTGTTSYDVYFGTSSPPAYVDTVTESYYEPGVLSPFTTYYWYIVANNSCANVTGNEWHFETGGKLWTFMVYLDADNNLEEDGIDDFLEMATAGSNEFMNIVVQFDRISGYDTSYGSWTTTKRFYITNGLTPDPGNEIEDLGELNHGDPDTLVDFIDWAKTNYPAQRYALILWNHGGGWRESKEAELQAKLEGKDMPYYRAVCWDDTDGEDTLYMDEVQEALISAGWVDLIGFDACLMAMSEVAYEIKDQGEVMVGSEEAEPGDGWPYDTLLQDLANNPGWSSDELGEAIVNRYYESYGDDETQSALDLGIMDSLASAISSFAQAMIDNWDSDEGAVRSAAQDVMTEIENAVINERHGSGWPGANGLAIYFPQYSGDFNSDYTGAVIDFADDTQWDEFLQEYYSFMGGSWIADARGIAQEFAYPEYIDLYDFCYRIVHVSDLYYTETQIPNDFLGGGTAQSFHEDDEVLTYSLPFDFTYFGEVIPAGTNFYICTNGFIDLEDPSTDPSDTVAELIASKRIAVLWEDLVTDGSAQPGEDIYITENPGSLVIRWVAETFWNAHPVDFELVLYSDGRIQFNYDGGNDLTPSAFLIPTIGISKGDSEYYNLSVYNGVSLLTNVESDLFSIPIPPEEPGNPSPENGATDVPLDIELDWDDCSKASSYDVYFGTSSPPPYVATVSSSQHDPGTLVLNTDYYWKIVAKNTLGDETEGAEWQFTTCTTLPSEPVVPSPGDSTTGHSLETDLTWEDSGDATSYDVYFGTSSPPEYVATVTEKLYDPGPLSACSTYYWKIVSRNTCGETEGSEWNFETILVTPEAFSNVSPSNGETDVYLDADLDWEDSEGASSYDVYFGQSSSPPFVATVNESYYDPGELAPLTTYHWKIKAKNSCGEIDGPEWQFTTAMKPWTFMVYLDGDNDLEAAGIDDFLEMASIGSNAAVNIVVQFDRIYGYTGSYGDWTSTKRFYITPGMTPSPENALSDMGELNHGDPQTLINFVNWAKQNYPAQNYALVLWNHGGGWRLDKEEREVRLIQNRKELNFKAACWDDTDGHDSLYMDEVQSALNACGGAELIGFDACLMGMVEVAYEIRDHGEVLVGSEETEPGDGWPYDTILQDLTNNPSWSSSELGECIVDRYYESYGNGETQSAIDLSHIEDLANSIGSFAQAMIDNWSSDPAAVKIAASGVLSQLDDTVIHEQHGTSWRNANGLAVYLPEDSGDFNSEYRTVIDFSNDTQWDEFIQAFHSSMGGSWIDDMRQLTQDFAYPTHIDLYHFCSLLVIEEIEFYNYSKIFPEYEGGGAAQGFQYDDRIMTYTLPFDFSYFGEIIPSGRDIYICTDGYIDFENPVPEINSLSKLANNKRIAPCWTDLRTDGSAQAGEDIYITHNTGSARNPDNLVIRWVAETHGSGEPVDFELILYDDGNIQFNYGSGNADFSGRPPTIGVSYGDGVNRCLSDYNGATSLTDVNSDVYTLREIRTINLTIEAGGGGTIFPLPGSHSYPVGQQITITAVPDRYCDFDYWSGDISGSQSPRTITVSSDLNITANFFRVYPPSNFDVRQESNRSLLMVEDINVLTWQDNPLNPSQKITNYSIYSDAGGAFSLLDSVERGDETGDLEYWHRDVDKTQSYSYGICAVTTRGVESEPSFRTIQGESGPESTSQTRSTTAEQNVMNNKARDAFPIIIGPSSKGSNEEKTRNILKPLNFAAQRAFDYTIPDGRYVNILSWQANPENKDIDKYMIYCMEGKELELLAELEPDTLEFRHEEVELNKMYTYALVAVDKKKRQCKPVYTQIK